MGHVFADRGIEAEQNKKEAGTSQAVPREN